MSFWGGNKGSKASLILKFIFGLIIQVEKKLQSNFWFNYPGLIGPCSILLTPNEKNCSQIDLELETCFIILAFLKYCDTDIHIKMYVCVWLSVWLIIKYVGKQNWIYTYSKWRGLAKTYLRVDYFKIFSIPMYILILFYILSCIQTHREKIDRLVYGNTMYRTVVRSETLTSFT